jgi:hypothetical protein
MERKALRRARPPLALLRYGNAARAFLSNEIGKDDRKVGHKPLSEAVPKHANHIRNNYLREKQVTGLELALLSVPAVRHIR